MSNPAGTLQRYQRWSGKPARWGSAWVAMVRNGIRLANKDSQARFLVWFSLSFIVGNCAFFYAFSVLEPLAASNEAQPIYQMAHTFLGIDLSGIQQLGALRELLWRKVYLLAFKVELFWVMTTVSRVGPNLIADDIRTRALPIYFSKPLTPLTYIAAKWAVAAAFVGLVTLVPNLAAMLLDTLITGGLNSVGQSLDLALDIVITAFGIMVIGGLVVLALSSLSSDKRYVSVGWWAVCILPVIAQSVVNEGYHGQVGGFLGSIALHTDILVLAEWLFDMPRVVQQSGLADTRMSSSLMSQIDPKYPAMVLGVIVLLCAIVCYRRVMRFSRQAANLQ